MYGALAFFRVEGEGWQCRWSQEQRLMPKLFGGVWVCRHLGWRSPFGWQCNPSCQYEVLLCLPSGCFYSWIAMWKTLELQVSWWSGARAGAHELGSGHRMRAGVSVWVHWKVFLLVCCRIYWCKCLKMLLFSFAWRSPRASKNEERWPVKLVNVTSIWQ